METLIELRKELKLLGFSVKTESLSWGKHATYFRISDKKELKSNVFTPETLAIWKPLLDYKINNRDRLQNLRLKSQIIGLI